jgi:hypothetical protein
MYKAGAIGKLLRTLQSSSLNSLSWSKYFEESCASQSIQNNFPFSVCVCVCALQSDKNS